jgi:hypothetical protein
MSDILTYELMSWIGLDTTPVLEKAPNCVEDGENIDFDERRMIVKRRGVQSISISSSTLSGT